MNDQSFNEQVRDHNPRDSALEAENAALRKLVTDLWYAKAVYKDSMEHVKAAAPDWVKALWREAFDIAVAYRNEQAHQEDDDDGVPFKGDWTENRLLTSDLV